MKKNNVTKMGLNMLIELLTDNVQNYAVNDVRLVGFGKERFFKRTKPRTNYNFFGI